MTAASHTKARQSPTARLVRRIAAAGAITIAVATALYAQTPSIEPAASQKPLAAAGNDNMAWLIHGETPDPPYHNRINRFAWMGKGDAAFKTLNIDAEIGRIARYTASGYSLYVFYDDGVFYSYSTSGRHVEIDLPGKTIPLAIAGESGRESRVYALVPRRIGRIIAEKAAATTSSAPAAGHGTKSGPAAPTTAPKAETESDDAEGELDIVVYEKLRWQRLTAVATLPDDLRPKRWWLSANDDTLCLYWQTEEDSPEIRCVQWMKQNWSAPETITYDAPVVAGKAVFVESRPTFVAATRRDDTLEIQWHITQFFDNRWQHRTPLKFSAAADTVPDPRRSDATAFGQNILLAVAEENGAIATGLWPADGGKAVRDLQSTNAFKKTTRPMLDAQTRDWIGLLVIAVIIMMVWWRRQNSLSTTADLPQGYRLAPAWKRLVAFALDMLPAVALTAWIWLMPLMEYSLEIYNTTDWQNTPWPEAPPRFLLGWTFALVIHVIYCGVFEAIRHATPGKRLLGCTLLNEAGRSVALRQVVIRNAVRFLELSPYLQIWPLLLMVFFTRNSQRLGDILAQTLVVERDPNAPPPEHHLDETA